jgi:hypothetical protein
MKALNFEKIIDRSYPYAQTSETFPINLLINQQAQKNSQ